MSSSSLAGTARRLAGNVAAAVTGSSPRVQAVLLLTLALPQLYLLPEGSLDVALSTFVTVLLLAGVLLRAVRAPGRPLAHLGLLGVLAALLAVRILAVAWSPDPRAGMQPVAILGQFVVALMVMSAALREDPKLLTYVQRLYWPWVVAEACLVVVFRFLPGVEDAFLRSIGGVFVGQNTAAALFGDGRNNVLDVAKAGGVFVNANVAAMFLGVNGLAALAVFAVTRARWVAAVGVTALVAVPFTGSKSATVLAFTLPALALGAYQMTRSVMPARRRYLLLGALAAGSGAILAALIVNTGLRNAMVEAFVGRMVIWGFGAQSFRHSPILGLGYGGWDAGFPLYAAEHGLYKSFPPHNVLLAAWSTTGIAGLVLTLGFFALLVRLVVRGLSGRAAIDRKFVAFAGAAIAWTFIQGMGENTDIFGEIHLIPVLALLLVHLIQPIGEEATGNATQAYRRRRATPAIPAVGDVHPQPGDGAAPLPAAVRGEGPGPDHAGSRLG